MNLTITLTSDFICPWCFVAERRLQQALDSLEEKPEVQYQWRPYLLNPDMPAEGMDRKVYRSNKFGSWERSQMLDAQTVAAAKGDALTFNYPAMRRTPSTLAAHRLMLWADAQGQAHALAGAIFSAYFEQGRDIGDVAVLTALAGEVGLNAEQAADYLRSDEGRDRIFELDRQARERQVRSVPLVEIGTGVISGAQAPEAFLHALQMAVDHA